MPVEVIITRKTRAFVYNAETKENQWQNQQITVKVSKPEDTVAAQVDAYCEANELFFKGSFEATARRKASGKGKQTTSAPAEDFNDMADV